VKDHNENYHAFEVVVPET
jgi:hypothetical protein